MSKIIQNFKNISYGPALEDSKDVMSWINSLNNPNDLFINGAWVKSKSSKKIQVINPASNKKLTTLSISNKTDVNAAVGAAKKAYTSWSKTSSDTRAKYLYALARLIQKHSRFLSVLETIDNGKPIRETRDIDIPLVARHFYYHAGWAKKIDTKVKKPIGVIGQIIPWNFPLLMMAWKIAPAIAAGNTVVLKPAEFTSLTALYFAELCQKARLPKGVINIITGDGSTGELITSHIDTKKIAFTGSTEVGRILMRQCSDQIKKVSLELGGNAPFIVFDDADIDEAVSGAMISKYRNAGQTCVCANRIYVQDGIYDEFSKKLATATKAMRVGNGFDDNVTTGPLIDSQALDKVEEHIQDAVSKGASILSGGKRSELGGTFFNPTVLTDVTSSMKVAKEETFGPVAPLFKFDSVDDVIEAANDTEFGLAAYFYAKDLSKVWKVAEALEYGIVGINTGIISTEVAPFGGIKQSGLGREGSKYGIDDFLEIKYLCMSGI